MATMQISAPDGAGSFDAYVAMPETTPAGGLVVIQEIFGVNKVMRDLCDGFAKQGYLAVSPDIFWRIQPGVDLTDQTDEEWQKAFELMQKFDQDQGIEDIKATLAAVRGHEACTGKVGTVGYCLGGRLAFMMATRSDADANVAYYGVGLDGLVGELDTLGGPLLLHMPTEDSFFPADQQEPVKQAAAKHDKVEVCVYEGNEHAFAREGGQHYDPAAAEKANMRTLDFFRMHLGN
jgi:carboxymethylenebutenolidase